jgi:spore germination protein KC
LSSVIALVPSMSHCKMLVVGEDVARQGLGDIWGPLFRYREFRGAMFVLVARGTAKEFLEANKPVFNISTSKYFEMTLASGSDAGYYLRTSLHQFYTRLKSKSIQSYAPLVAVNPQSGQGESTTKKVPGGKIEGYIAGDIPRQGGNPIEFAGTAIFSGDKMVGTLSTTETRMLAMLLGEYPHGFLSVQDPLAPKFFANVNLHLGSTPKIKVVLVEGRPVITVTILLEGEFTNLPSGINYEEESYLKLYEAQVNKVVQQEMVNMIRHTQELNSDVAGFGYYIRPFFSNYHEYENCNWLEEYGQAQVHVTINTKVRRTGLMLRSAIVPEGL